MENLTDKTDQSWYIHGLRRNSCALREINIPTFVDHFKAFHCPFSKWLCIDACHRTGSNMLLCSTGGKSKHQTDFRSQVLTHEALQSPEHSQMCYPTLLEQYLLHYPACPWKGKNLARGQPPAESSPCQVCQVNWFSSKTFGSLWAIRSCISSPCCSKVLEPKSPIWTGGHKVLPRDHRSPTKWGLSLGHLNSTSHLTSQLHCPLQLCYIVWSLRGPEMSIKALKPPHFSQI